MDDEANVVKTEEFHSTETKNDVKDAQNDIKDTQNDIKDAQNDAEEIESKSNDNNSETQKEILKIKEKKESQQSNEDFITFQLNLFTEKKINNKYVLLQLIICNYTIITISGGESHF